MYSRDGTGKTINDRCMCIKNEEHKAQIGKKKNEDLIVMKDKLVMERHQ